MTPEDKAFVLAGSNARGRSSLCENALPFAQQDWIHDQHDFIRKPVFEQRRCERGAAPEDKVRAILRLNVANALDNVRPNNARPNRLERAPIPDSPACGSRRISSRR